MITFSYCRNSITQEIQKLSIENQMSKIKEIARSKMMILKEENQFYDIETSARKTKTEQRRGMSQLLLEIKKDNVRTLLVYSRCRLARNVQQHMEIYRILWEHNVDVHFALENEVPMMYSPEGELIERILAAFNQQNGEDIVTKLKDSKVTVARGGKHAAGPINFGYIKNPKSKGDWLIDEKESPIVKELYELFLNESFKNLNEFTKLVNKKGLRFNGSKGWREWKGEDVKKILTNQIYRGERHYLNGEELITNFVPNLVIVDQSKWEHVQIKMQYFDSLNPKKKTDDQEEEVTFLLNNLIYCTECGKKLKTSNTGRIYYCPKHRKYFLRKEELENEIIYYANQFFNKMLTKEYKKVVATTLESKRKHYDKVEKFLESANQNLQSKIAFHIDQFLLIDEYENLPEDLVKCHEKIEELTKSYMNFKDCTFQTIEAIGKLLEFHKEYCLEQNILEESLDDETKRCLLQNIIQGIYCGTDKNIEVIFKHPFLNELTGGYAIELA